MFNFQSLGIFRKNSFFLNSQKFCKKSLEISSDQKKPVFEAKTGVLGSKTGVSKYSELTKILEFFFFPKFLKITKNDVKIELQKSLKTRSNLNSDLNIRVQVRNAGP